MEKYKYCNIGPASSPRVGGREGGRRVRFHRKERQYTFKILYPEFVFLCCNRNAFSMHRKPRL